MLGVERCRSEKLCLKTLVSHCKNNCKKLKCNGNFSCISIQRTLNFKYCRRPTYIIINEMIGRENALLVFVFHRNECFDENIRRISAAMNAMNGKPIRESIKMSC